LTEAGFPDGFDVTLHVRKLFEDAGLLVKEQLANAGIRVDLRVLPDTEILPGLRKHQYTFYLSRIGSPTGDASDVTDNCLHSLDPAKRYGVMNYGEYKNPEVDKAIEESARIPQLEKRRNLIQSIMRTVMEDVVWVPLYIDQDVFAIDQRFSWKPRNDSFVFASEIK
jgi:peptide/nickel transport system substrate-binding protein